MRDRSSLPKTAAPQVQDGETKAARSKPFWRVSYQYRPQPSDIDSYNSWATSAEAIAAAGRLISEPELYDKVRISWPHYLHEQPAGEGWIAVSDLTPEQKRSLDLLLMPKENEQ